MDYYDLKRYYLYDKLSIKDIARIMGASIEDVNKELRQYHIIDDGEQGEYKCNKCMYRGKYGELIYCNYLEITKSLRGCSPMFCDKYKKGGRDSAEIKKLRKKIQY